jgi:hypothetical protein
MEIHFPHIQTVINQLNMCQYHQSLKQIRHQSYGTDHYPTNYPHPLMKDLSLCISPSGNFSMKLLVRE